MGRPGPSAEPRRSPWTSAIARTSWEAGRGRRPPVGPPRPRSQPVDRGRPSNRGRHPSPAGAGAVAVGRRPGPTGWALRCRTPGAAAGRPRGRGGHGGRRGWRLIRRCGGRSSGGRARGRGVGTAGHSTGASHTGHGGSGGGRGQRGRLTGGRRWWGGWRRAVAVAVSVSVSVGGRAVGGSRRPLDGAVPVDRGRCRGGALVAGQPVGKRLVEVGGLSWGDGFGGEEESDGLSAGGELHHGGVAPVREHDLLPAGGGVQPGPHQQPFDLGLWTLHGDARRGEQQAEALGGLRATLGVAGQGHATELHALGGSSVIPTVMDFSS